MAQLRAAFGVRRRSRCCGATGDGWARRERRRRAGARHAPRTRDVIVPLDADTVLAVVGPRPRRRRPRRAPRVRRPARARGRAAAAPRRGRGGRGPRRGERAAHRAARRGVARPAHAARVDQGVGDEPAPARRRLDAETHEREFLETIDEETDRLNPLVGNLLDMSRLQTGALRARDARRSGSRRSCPRALAGLGDTAGRGRASTCPRRCRACSADAALLERAVANLVDERARASPPDRPVRVEAGAVRRPGRPARRRPRARASRADQRERRVPAVPAARRPPATATGVGLGLAVARGFVEAMGGELTVEDTPGGGTTMVVSLPAAPVDVSRAACWSSTTSRRSAARSASTCGPAATTSTSRATGEQALELAARHHPDVVVLDLGLPGIDGVEVIRGPPRLEPGADHRAVGARGGGGQGRRARRRRRRLRHQAVRHGRAARPAARRAAPRRRRPRRRRSSRPPTSPSTSRPSGCTRDGDEVRLTPTEWHLVEVLVRNRASSSPSASCSRRSGARSTTTRRTTCASTWPRCAASSSPSPAARATSSPSRGWATASRRERLSRSTSSIARRARIARRRSLGLGVGLELVARVGLLALRPVPCATRGAAGSAR